MKHRMLLVGMAAVVLVTCGIVLARKQVMYVKVRAAKLRASLDAGDTRAVAYLPHGTEVEILAEQGSWYKARVVAANGVFEGWVHKTQVQSRRPPQEAARSSKLSSALAGLDKTKVDATKSASSRGLLQSDNYAKARNLEKELQWIEQTMVGYVPTAEELDLFMQEGGLGIYRED